MRIKSHWFKSGRDRSPREIADALSFTTWRIADNALKNTRNADYEIAVGPQYFAFLAEFLIYLIMVADRIIYAQLSAEDRNSFTGTLANRVAETFAENHSRLLESDIKQSKQQFIDQLNQRAGEYAEFEYGEDGPSFAFTRYLAFCLDGIMDAKDNGWIIDQIMAIEAPQAVKMVEKTLRDLNEEEPRTPRKRAASSGD